MFYKVLGILGYGEKAWSKPLKNKSPPLLYNEVIFDKYLYNLSNFCLLLFISYSKSIDIYYEKSALV
jgi:hypothetical protein